MQLYIDLRFNYRFIAKTEVVIGRSQPEPRSGEGCDQADHGRPVEAMKVFLATVSQTNGRGPRCTEADQAGIEAPVLSLQLDDPSRKRTRCGIQPWSKRCRQ